MHQILHVVLCLVQKVNRLQDCDLRKILWKVQLQDCLSLVTYFTFPVPAHGFSFLINRGYYMAARRYEISLRVLRSLVKYFSTGFGGF